MHSAVHLPQMGSVVAQLEVHCLGESGTQHRAVYVHTVHKQYA